MVKLVSTCVLLLDQDVTWVLCYSYSASLSASHQYINLKSGSFIFKILISPSLSTTSWDVPVIWNAAHHPTGTGCLVQKKYLRDCGGERNALCNIIYSTFIRKPLIILEGMEQARIAWVLNTQWGRKRVASQMCSPGDSLGGDEQSWMKPRPTGWRNTFPSWPMWLVGFIKFYSGPIFHP